MKIEEMSHHHQFVWNVLQGLEVGERIIGPDLMSRSGIRERRQLYQIIKDLRNHGFLIGSSKQPGSNGYFEIKDQIDLRRTLSSLRDAAISLLDTAESIERTFNEQRFSAPPLEDEEGEDGE